mmetsp:Transcript_51215/g.89401  ORF Transcript_51215/g.89401 Transcript_51215/m.89401 type:complete len:227 (-) Transcript_51215:1072-1752(-)
MAPARLFSCLARSSANSASRSTRCFFRSASRTRSLARPTCTRKIWKSSLATPLAVSPTSASRMCSTLSKGSTKSNSPFEYCKISLRFRSPSPSLSYLSKTASTALKRDVASAFFFKPLTFTRARESVVSKVRVFSWIPCEIFPRVSLGSRVTRGGALGDEANPTAISERLLTMKSVQAFSFSLASAATASICLFAAVTSSAHFRSSDFSIRGAAASATDPAMMLWA